MSKAEERIAMNTAALDLDLTDSETVEEMRLVTELMLIAVGAAEDLDQDVVDAALGVPRVGHLLPPQRRPA